MVNSAVGKWAEDIAAHFLERKGYRILERNFNTRFGELDIVCQERRGEPVCSPLWLGQTRRSAHTLIFAEVRYRGRGSYLLPEETLTTKKQRRLRVAAMIYINKFGLIDPFMRFDVICISRDAWFKPVKVQHIMDAF